ncbi:cytochrome c biogenesis protein [Verrucomicrobia bacterium]|nr:cytochrome c biogenesis protein [Verrucomicrobiota bacterium]
MQIGSDKILFLIAVLLYGVSLVYSVFLWRKGFRKDNHINYFIILVGMLFHTASLMQRGFSLNRCPVHNLYEAVSFVDWTIAASFLIIGLLPRLRFIGVFASPILFCTGVFSLVLGINEKPGSELDFSMPLVSPHAALVMLAYGAYGLSAIAGGMFLTQEHDLKFHKARAILSLLPPIQKLEHLIARLMLAGQILLTAGMSLTPFLMLEKYQKFFVPDLKSIWALFVWMMYTALYLAHWKFDLGGRRLAWGTVLGFTFVMLTFWGVNLLSGIHSPQ